jgi:hypothetical protein
MQARRASREGSGHACSAAAVAVCLCQPVLYSGSPRDPIALIDRGAGLIYDAVLNITWLQNTNLANQSFNTWEEAMTWADDLVCEGYDDWRLPDSPATQQGWINEGEMGHLYYTTLGNVAFDPTPSLGPFTNFPDLGAGPYGVYWLSADPLFDGSAWAFEFYILTGNSGFQNAWSNVNQAFGWAVRDGDSVPVPEPTTFLSLTAGLALLALSRRGRHPRSPSDTKIE